MSTMDYVPAKVLVKQPSSTYGPLNLDVSSSYGLAVVPRRSDHIDYSMTKGGLRSWLCVFTFILLVTTFSSFMPGEKEDEIEEDIFSGTTPEVLSGDREEMAPKDSDLEPKDFYDESHVTTQEIGEEEQLLMRLRLKAAEIAKKIQKNKSVKSTPKLEERIPATKMTKKMQKSRKQFRDETPQYTEVVGDEFLTQKSTPSVEDGSHDENMPKITKKRKFRKKLFDDTLKHEDQWKFEPPEEQPGAANVEDRPENVRVDEILIEAGIVHGSDEKTDQKVQKTKKFQGKKVQFEMPADIMKTGDGNVTRTIKIHRTKGKLDTSQESTTSLKFGSEKKLLTRGFDVLRKSEALRDKVVKFFRTKTKKLSEAVKKLSEEKSKVEVKYFKTKERKVSDLPSDSKQTVGAKTTLKFHRTKERQVKELSPNSLVVEKDKIEVKFHRTKGKAKFLDFKETAEDVVLSKSQNNDFCEDDLDKLCDFSQADLSKNEVANTNSISVEIPAVDKAEKATVETLHVDHEKKPRVPVKVFKRKGKTSSTGDPSAELLLQAVPLAERRSDEPKQNDEEPEVQHANFKQKNIEMKRMMNKAHRFFIQGKLEEANFEYSRLIAKFPENLQILHLKAKVLDRLADLKKSNKLLEESIKDYETILGTENVPEDLYQTVASRLVDRLQFRGWVRRALNVQEKLVKKFPKNVDNQINFGLSNLALGIVDDAKKAFGSVLKNQPKNAHASALYGYILKKFENKLEDSIEFLKNGIESESNETQDVRFFYHLGDALQQLNRGEEAYEIYEKAAEKGLFLSKYQRSMHNVEGLRAKPWWTILETGYQQCFNLIEKDWQLIRDEAMLLVEKNGRSLDTDEEKWAEPADDLINYLLFSHGQKLFAHCSRVPKTCAILGQCPAAAGCHWCRTGFAYLRAGTLWGPHCGPSNCRLRAFLTLTGSPSNRLRVADEQRIMRRGKFAIFDDSFEHEMRVDGEKLGGGVAGGEPQFWLALQMDIWHPDLTDQQKNSVVANV